MTFYPGGGSGGGLQPWQFTPETYGARGDGKVGSGGTGNSGQNVLTDTSASFTAADVGKVIVVNQGAAGSFTNPLTTTISGFNSATSVNLAANFAAAVGPAAPYVYGTDDAAAINSAVSAAVTYGTAHVQKVQVIFAAKLYMLAALTQQTSPTQYNCHIPIPVGPQLGTKLSIEFVGSGTDSSFPQYWESSFPSLSGTCLVSAVFATGQPNGTFGQQSIIGGPTAVTANMSPGNFANTIATLNGINIIVPFNAQQFGMDGTLLAQMDVYPTGSAQVFAPVNLSGAASGGPNLTAANLVNNNISVGFAFPQGGNNANCNMGNVQATGWANGFRFTEHITAQRLMALYCNNGILINAPNGHGAAILRYIVEASNNGINTANSVAAQTYNLFIGQWESETLNTAHIVDVNSNLMGVINWSDTSSTRPVVTTGNNLIVIDSKKHFTGPWSGAPAAPATATAQQNLSYRWATVICSATTAITAVAVGQPNVSTGLTNTGQTAAISTPIPVRVAPGGYFSVTYGAGVLTTTWILD